MSVPFLPVRFDPSPWRAAAGGEDFLEAVVEERVEVGVGDEVDRAAGPAVAAARAAAGDELLAPERHGAAAAVSGGDVDVDFVYEHNRDARPARRAS